MFYCPNYLVADGSSFRIGGVIGDPIIKFKSEILKLRGIPIHQQTLLYQGRALEDQQIYSHAVSSYNETLDLIIRHEADIITDPVPTNQLEDDEEDSITEREAESAEVVSDISDILSASRVHGPNNEGDGEDDDAGNKLLNNLMAEWTTVFEKSSP